MRLPIRTIQGTGETRETLVYRRLLGPRSGATTKMGERSLRRLRIIGANSDFIK